ncbi:Uncharacterized protein dnl_07770 [Desulfonema limicola]|uniref:Uncharacterized protein n=1 Tax=Desulfonema limicola TaxID=45656 RepID=A0A975GEU2_9BACT|nr:Uncharacterized protein dnl_07770 [Desulfonema limicola]
MGIKAVLDKNLSGSIPVLLEADFPQKLFFIMKISIYLFDKIIYSVQEFFVIFLKP